MDGGEGMRCGAKDWGNFLRVDDEDNEVVPKIVEGKEKVIPIHKLDNVPESIPNDYYLPEKIDPLEALKQMVKIYEELPKEAQQDPVSNSDMHSILILLEKILCKENKTQTFKDGDSGPMPHSPTWPDKNHFP